MDINKQQCFSRLFLLISLFILLSGCASSDLSRETAGQLTGTSDSILTALKNSTQTNIAAGYRNSSQTTKGMLIGGTTGALAGGLASGATGMLPGAAGGAIFGGAIGAYIDANTTLADQIINRGNKVIVLGDQILIVLPSRRLFREYTAEFNPYAYQTLNVVARFISSYPNIAVTITAYTNSLDAARISRAFAQDQANAVMKYLWRTGVNTRLLSAVGAGGAHPVQSPEFDWNRGENYRIEITLEKLPV